MAYLLDTNIFIEAKNHYYGFDLCPGFWMWLDSASSKGQILSVKKVRDELMGRKDRLANWCKSRSKMFVDTNDGQTYASLALLSSWVSDNYTDAAQAKFFGDADFILVGYAHAHNHIVVTTKISANGMQVKIPNACRAMNVRKMTPFEMLAAEKVKFYLPV